MRIPPDDRSAVTRRRALSGAAALVAVVVLALLGTGVATGFGPQLRLDDAASRIFYVGDRPPTWLHVLLGIVTAPGLTVVRLILFLPVVVWLLRNRAWWTAAWVAVTVTTIAPLTTLLKDFFDRVRPAFENGGARLHSLSFPSGHSSGIAAAVTVALVLAWPLLGVAARRIGLAVGVVAIVVVGLGRMWQGVHYLTDVLGGWTLGIAWALLLALVFRVLPGDRAAVRARGPANVGAAS